MGLMNWLQKLFRVEPGGWKPPTPSPHRPTGPVLFPSEEAAPPERRNLYTGMVGIQNGSFTDDLGAFPALGASLFWALWGEKHDPDRLDQNLQYLADRGVDYVRILCMVGSESWKDRVIDPEDPEYWVTVRNFRNRAARYGLRIQFVLFADAQVMMPDKLTRQSWVRRWVEELQTHPEQIMFVEICNEHFQNGLETAELQEHGWSLHERLECPIALSATHEDGVAALYSGWPSLATHHYDRDVSKADGIWRPVRQPWGWPHEYFPEGAGMPAAVVNNEPIGPGSSVAEDADMDRIILAALTTFIAGNAGYCYHSGAGIRGGGIADRERGRAANLWDQPDHLTPISDWLAQMPSEIVQKGSRTNAQWETFPWDGSQHAVDRGDIMRAYGRHVGPEFWCVVLDAKRAHTIHVKAALDLTLYRPDGLVAAGATLAAGEAYTIPANPGSGWIIYATSGD